MSSQMFQVLGIIDKLNEINEKLNGYAAGHMDNVWVGVAIIGVLMLVVVWGINILNK